MGTIKKKIDKTNVLGNIEKAKDIILKYEEKNDISDSEVIINMRYILWAGFKVFKRNTVDDKDKKFYSHALHVNTYYNLLIVLSESFKNKNIIIILIVQSE